jgi:drug/metabolite transporter (DMT)-like permease
MTGMPEHVPPTLRVPKTTRNRFLDVRSLARPLVSNPTGEVEAPGSGLFARFFAAEAVGRRDPRLGYLIAALSAAISGVSVYVNSLGVRTFSDPVLYTALKDAFVGLVLLVPLVFSPGWRVEYRRLDGRTWSWMIALALTGGSVPFALFYTGLQMTTAATGALINHFQFVLVALFAVVFLKERIRPVMWAGFAVLLLGTMLGSNLNTLEWNQGALLVAGSTVLFAIDFVIAKHLLRSLSTLTVMTARMTIGTAMLFAYVIAVGGAAPVTQLTGTQWLFVVVTGFTLLLFTTTTFTAIRHASVSAVLAIGTAAPIVTTLLQVIASRRAELGVADLAGLAVTLVAAIVVISVGIRQDKRLSSGAAVAS